MSENRVAVDLRAIQDMAERLEQRAIDRASDQIPGGDAMVNLAVVADMSKWERRNQLANDDLLQYEDMDDLWSTFQLLRFWSEAWRIELGMDHDDPRWRPSLASESAFLRNPDVLAWAWDNELHWDDFAADMTKARVRLETVLVEGERAERGVPCMYPECRGARIVRKLEPYRAKDGEKGWRRSDWHCPRCHRKWNNDRYAAMVTAASEGAKIEDINGATWCTPDYAARKLERPVKTIRTWMDRDQLTTACIIAGRRLPFISLDEVRELAEKRPQRKRRVRA